jgi:hypothetical protein
MAIGIIAEVYAVAVPEMSSGERQLKYISYQRHCRGTGWESALSLSNPRELQNEECDEADKDSDRKRRGHDVRRTGAE